VSARVWTDRRGFSVVELLITMVIGAIILGATYGVMVSQQRFFARQTQVQDTRETLRAAAAIVAAELRQASAEGGDLLAIAPDSFVLRTTIGFGVVCGMNAPQKRLNVIQMTGEWSPGDSALVFRDNAPGTADDEWSQRLLVSVDRSSPGTCAWGAPAEALVTLDTVRVGVRVGAQVRPFRWYVYKLVREGDRFWLGRRRLDETRYTAVVGPLLPPGAGSGLALTYLDGSGNPTDVPSSVRSVRFTVRAQSFGRAPGLAGAASGYVEDTLSARAFLRNN
jgi:prepilin-type N-terminal cleavage/methylation domain-containing protein